jgi:hypothetical protein
MTKKSAQYKPLLITFGIVLIAIIGFMYIQLGVTSNTANTPSDPTSNVEVRDRIQYVTIDAK